MAFHLQRVEDRPPCQPRGRILALPPGHGLHGLGDSDLQRPMGCLSALPLERGSGEEPPQQARRPGMQEKPLARPLPRPLPVQVRPLALDPQPCSVPAVREGSVESRPVQRRSLKVARASLGRQGRRRPGGDRWSIVLRVIPWILFFLVAFRLVPTGWEFEHLPWGVQTAATVAFGLFVLLDTSVTVWNVALRPVGRETV